MNRKIKDLLIMYIPYKVIFMRVNFHSKYQINSFYILLKHAEFKYVDCRRSLLIKISLYILTGARWSMTFHGNLGGFKSLRFFCLKVFKRVQKAKILIFHSQLIA